jgi:tyrosine-protein kinase Etk/Wzc
MHDREHPVRKEAGYEYLDDDTRAFRLNASLSWGALALWNGRRIILSITAVAAVAAVVISLLLPNWYQSSARVLMPEAGSGAMGALLSNISPQAARLFGGIGGSSDYNRPLTILSSNSMMDAVIERFDLMEVYETAGKSRPVTTTRQKLRRNTSFEVDMKHDYLTISVTDRDPERAALMANFIVEELNRRNAELLTQDAANYRQFVEMRYHEVIAALDSAQHGFQTIQEQIGVVELPTSAEAFYRAVAQQRAGMLELEIQHSALLDQYGPENPRVQATGRALAAARAAERSAITGGDPLMPLGLRELPAAANRYATAYREVLLQGELLKVVQPLYEQARFEEERDKVTVQVVDYATPPEMKARPFRALIVVASTLSAFLLSVSLVLGISVVRDLSPRIRGSIWRSIRASNGVETHR